MVYKLANISDLAQLPKLDPRVKDTLFEYTKVLTYEYGADRNVDTSDGGYVLYATPGTPAEAIKPFFDYSAHCLEYVNRDLQASPPICAALYILTNDYAVVIVMALSDAPPEIANEIDPNY